MNSTVPKLLVSVRDAVEAVLAVQANVAIVDVKEPNRGALGCVDMAQLEAICNVVGGRLPVSVALGELLDQRCWDVATIPPTVTFAKLGLAGCNSHADWRARWQRQVALLPPKTRPVAVVYADSEAGAPPVPEVIHTAEKLACAAVLLDTYDKRQGRLLDHWRMEQISEFVGEVHRRRMISVVAGGLSLADLPCVLPASPRLIGVRGAVCRGTRTGEISFDLLAEFARALDFSRGGRLNVDDVAS